MLRTTLCLMLLIVSLAAGVSAQAPAPSDFPPHDQPSVSLFGRDGGRSLVSALRQQPPRAAALEVLLRQGYPVEAMTVLNRIVDADGAELLPALTAASPGYQWWTDQRSRDAMRTSFARIVNRVTAAARRRPREEAAAITRQLLWVQENIASTRSRDTWSERLRQFSTAYDGTAAAAFADIEQRVATSRAEEVDTFEQYAREHPGTTAGARALFEAAFQLGVNYAVTGIERAGTDPTDRLMRVAALARELEDGGYPPSEWVARAPTLVTDFFVSHRVPTAYTSGSVERTLEFYRDFVRAHLHWPEPYPGGDALPGMVARSVWQLWVLQGDPNQRAEQFFADLAANPGDREVARFLQARTYLERTRIDPNEGLALRSRLIELLDGLARAGGQPVRRLAHAMLASEFFAVGDAARAGAEFARFVAAYPRSDWAWVAALRIGQCEESQQHWQPAADAYRRAATVHQDTPAAVLLGHAYAARALEQIGDFSGALADYRQASDAWFGSERRRYQLYIWRRNPPPPRPGVAFGYSATDVTRPALEVRRARLTAAVAAPGGVLLERARLALERGARQEARDLVAQFSRQFPGSPLATDARYLAHAADFADALDLAAADDPRDVAGAKQRLGVLSREPADAIVSLAALARASLAAIENASDGDALAKQALDGWLKRQFVRPAAPPASLAADVDAVRREVFRPLGGGIYPAHWNARDFPTALPPFLIVPAAVRVQESSGRVTIMAAARPLPGLENTLYLADEDLEWLRRIIVVLGGSRQYVSASVMATPNRPAGPSQAIMTLWNRFFPMRPGHWGGYVVETYPLIDLIEFTNPERTKASVAVTIGSSGGTVLLEKNNGEWRAVALVNEWIM